MFRTKWISILLASVLLLQPLACCKRISVVNGGKSCATDTEQVLYVTLNDGKQYELVEWEVGPQWVTGKRQMVRVSLEEDGTVTEEEYLEPARYRLTDVANLDVEKVDGRSLWVVGAIAGGVAGALAAIAAISGGDGGRSGATGPGPIGDK